MSSLYFSKFPKIEYNGNTIKNITLRAKVLENFKRVATNFYPYTIEDGQTADSLAYDYYDDPNYVWVIYLVNDIIDPYYDWPLSTVNFEKYIIKKYGSIAAAKSQVAYYKKIPIDYYVNVNDNTYVEAASNPGLANSSEWILKTIDEDIKIASLSNPDPAIWLEIDEYTRESEENENKRYIKLLDKRILQSFNVQFEELLNG